MSSINDAVVGGRLLRPIERWTGRQEPNRPGESVGDKSKTKDKECFRLVSQNINGIGQEANNTKEMGIKKFAQDLKVDILALQQLNVCWSKVSQKNKIWERFRHWEEHHNLSFAYNSIDKNSSSHQPGGVALLTRGKIAHTWVESGYDNEKLGRWTWSRFQGSCGRHLRVVSIYRPCKSTQRVNSVYMKQYGYSLEKRNGICPREMFLLDLEQEIVNWNELGDSIIIMGDFNQDVRSQELREWSERLGLEDKLLERVETEGTHLNTYMGGHAPIDTILCTNGVEISKAGYLPFGEGVGDHRPIFVDISIASTLGMNIPTPRSIKARRLKTNDPRITKNIIKHLIPFIANSISLTVFCFYKTESLFH
jgi:exonuclease III